MAFIAFINYVLLHYILLPNSDLTKQRCYLKSNTFCAYVNTGRDSYFDTRFVTNNVLRPQGRQRAALFAVSSKVIWREPALQSGVNVWPLTVNDGEPVGIAIVPFHD